MINWLTEEFDSDPESPNYDSVRGSFQEAEDKNYGIKASSKSGIYAVFKVEEDADFKGEKWNEDGIWELIKKKAHAMGSERISSRRSAYPVVLSLRSLLKASS